VPKNPDDIWKIIVVGRLLGTTSVNYNIETGAWRESASQADRTGGKGNAGFY
jgi:hypothetical protein